MDISTRTFKSGKYAGKRIVDVAQTDEGLCYMEYLIANTKDEYKNSLSNYILQELVRAEREKKPKYMIPAPAVQPFKIDYTLRPAPSTKTAKGK